MLSFSDSGRVPMDNRVQDRFTMLVVTEHTNSSRNVMTSRAALSSVGLPTTLGEGVGVMNDLFTVEIRS